MSENEHKEIVEAEVVKDIHPATTKASNSHEQAKATNNKFIAPILVDAILLALGIFLLIWADKVVNTISYIIGGIFLLYAIYNYVAFARAEKKSGGDYTRLLVAISLTIAGGFLIFQTDFLKDIISFIVGIFVILNSMFRLQDAFKLRKINKEAAKMPLIFACVSLFCGVLCILGKILIPDIFLQILGVMLIIFSFADIADLIFLRK